MKDLRLDYADLAAMIEYIKDKALKEGKDVSFMEDLLNYLDENVEGFINVIQRK